VVGNLKEKRPLGRPRRRWVGEVQTDLREEFGGLAEFLRLRIGTGNGLL
jgi:hypothetical protein